MMPLNEMIHSKSYQFKKYLVAYKKVISRSKLSLSIVVELLAM